MNKNDLFTSVHVSYLHVPVTKILAPVDILIASDGACDTAFFDSDGYTLSFNPAVDTSAFIAVKVTTEPVGRNSDPVLVEYAGNTPYELLYPTFDELDNRFVSSCTGSDGKKPETCNPGKQHVLY